MGVRPLVLPVVGRGHQQSQIGLALPLQIQYPAAEPVLDSRDGVARLQVEQQQFALEEITAVVLSGTDREQRKRGVEGHRVDPVPRTEQRTADQITGAVHADRRTAGEVVGVSARHGEHSAPVVGDSQGGFAYFGERAVAEHPVDMEK
ncbi:hypothetical protein [Streptomyces jumonjinensis]|uniref:Uncharacterized protein n=1 Tax=Streptomyces jumonjinensis TaxID=1945 RepID=A0A646KPT7_STRJU|nr:hypothetical protein [Streptomyces jumonjinensis]MQT04255.1 hypothetical protein [Streptomyces jumonjinensis]